MLLSVSKHPPHKVGSVYMLRDIITLYFDLRLNWWQSSCNDAISKGKDIDSMKDYLAAIHKEMQQKNRSGQLRKAVVFVNDLDVVRCVLPDGETVSRRKDKKLEFSLEIETDFFVFRNFNILFNRKTEKCAEMFPGVALCRAMAAYIKSFDLPITQMRFSLAYISKKIFYKDIKKELWEFARENSLILKSPDYFMDMHAGAQGGALSMFQPEQLQKVFYNVLSFDKKSAYPSFFIKDKFFPTGKIIKLNLMPKKKIEMLRLRLGAGKWCKVVIEPPEIIPELAQFKTPKKMLYGLEFWDFDTLKRSGIDYNAFLERYPFRLYISESTGYMPRCFREKIMKLYRLKNAERNKNSPKRFLYKTQLDMLYGKGLQKYDFKSRNDLFKKYVLRGENFLQPQMSMHVVAAMRHEILLVVSHFSSGCISFDTDGVKLQGDPDEIKRFFDLWNDFIMLQNEKAGFPSDIGIWDFEYEAERFIQFAPKVYAYQCCDECIVCKFAGMSERALGKYMQQINGDPFEVWQRDGIQAETGGGWLYIPEIPGFLEIKQKYSIRKDDAD